VRHNRDRDRDSERSNLSTGQRGETYDIERERDG